MTVGAGDVKQLRLGGSRWLFHHRSGLWVDRRSIVGRGAGSQMGKAAGGLFAGGAERRAIVLRCRLLHRFRQGSRNEEQHPAGRAIDGFSRLGRVSLQ
ncbi:MAG: hypothetical protein ACR2FY_00500 [Pirellulaceae bacterium]